MSDALFVPLHCFECDPWKRITITMRYPEYSRFIDEDYDSIYKVDSWTHSAKWLITNVRLQRTDVYAYKSEVIQYCVVCTSTKSQFIHLNSELILRNYFIQLDQMPSRNFENLRNHILPLSVNRNDFDEAKREWVLEHIAVTKDFGNCPCSQQIKEHCYLRNRLNRRTTYVGNVCVYRFIEIDARPIFNGLRRVRDNYHAKPNAALIEDAKNQGYLYGDNEYDFLQKIKRKRNLSEAQEQWLKFINRRKCNWTFTLISILLYGWISQHDVIRFWYQFMKRKPNQHWENQPFLFCVCLFTKSFNLIKSIPIKNKTFISFSADDLRQNFEMLSSEPRTFVFVCMSST